MFLFIEICSIFLNNQIFILVNLPPTKALPETQEMTQKMLATTTKYKVRTTPKKMDDKTTAFQQKTIAPILSQGIWLYKSTF